MSPIILQGSTSGPQATKTAQDVVSAVSQDIRSLLTTSSTILLDYVNRVHLEMLRTSRWFFLLSDTKFFATENNQRNYWVGGSGAAPANAVDTSLNLTDVWRIRDDSVFDRSNFKPLKRQREAPLLSTFAYQDSFSRPGRPRVFRSDPNNPALIEIFPAPDAENTFRPVPYAPIVTSAAGGSLAARTYFTRLTYVDNAGNESTGSLTARQFIPASQLATVKSPIAPVVTSTAGVQYTQYKVYASTTEGSEQLQTASAITIGTDWTEPSGGLISGVTVPSTNNLEPIRGYVIEFRYYKTRNQVTTLGTVLQIPDDYFDITVAGVNWLAYKFLKKDDEASHWFQIYKSGLIQIIKDFNLFPKGGDFIGPDESSITTPWQLTFDISRELYNS